MLLNYTSSAVQRIALICVIAIGPGLYCISSQAATLQVLGDLPGGEFSSSAFHVSTDGSTTIGTSAGEEIDLAFHWNRETGIQDLGRFVSESFDVNFYHPTGVSTDGSVIVGNFGFTKSIISLGFPFRWTKEDGIVALFGELEFGQTGGAVGVSGDGQVVLGLESWHPTDTTGIFTWTKEGGKHSPDIGFLVAHGQRANSMNPLGISDDGTIIVGNSRYSRPTSTAPNVFESIPLEPFFWSESNGLVGLDIPTGYESTHAWDFSPQGDIIVGTTKVSATLVSEAFIWTARDGMRSLGTLPGGLESSAYLVSADGSIVFGTSGHRPNPNGEALSTKVIWELVDREYRINSLDEYFRSRGIDLAGWEDVWLTDIADTGMTFVGYGLNPDGNREAWIVQLVPEPKSYGILLAGISLFTAATRYRYEVLSCPVFGRNGVTYRFHA